MKVSAKFLKSAVAPEHFPADATPEVAFLGRSNVGKSSLINALLGTKIAHVSSTPGRTQTINFIEVASGTGPSMVKSRFADLPGYGYAKVSRSLSAEWPKFIEPYLSERATLRLCVSLIDANIPAQEPDAQLIEWLKHNGRALLVVATKADKLGGNQLRNSLHALEREHGVPAILPVSARTGAGLERLWREIRGACADGKKIS
jgi:GTP-binding protein